MAVVMIDPGSHHARNGEDAVITTVQPPRVIEVSHPGLKEEIAKRHPREGVVKRARKNMSRRSRRGWRGARSWWRRSTRGAGRMFKKARGRMWRALVWTADKLAELNVLALRWAGWAYTPVTWLVSNTVALSMRSLGRLSMRVNKDWRWPHKLVRRFPHQSFQEIYADNLYGDRRFALALSWLMQPITGSAEHKARKDRLYMEVVSADRKHRGARRHFKNVLKREAYLEARAERRRAIKAAADTAIAPEPSEPPAQPMPEPQPVQSEPVVEGETEQGEVIVAKVVPTEQEIPPSRIIRGTGFPRQYDPLAAPVTFNDPEAMGWKSVENIHRRSYLFGCAWAIKAYEEDADFLRIDQVIAEVKTLCNNDAQKENKRSYKKSGRKYLDVREALRGFDEQVAKMREVLGWA